MKQVQGFVTKARHINNQAGQVAEFFELSPIGLTYSRNRGEYQHTNYPNFTLHTFVGRDTTTQEPYLLTSMDTAAVFALVNSMVTYLQGLPVPKSYAYFTQYMLANYHESIKAFEYGQMHEGSDMVLPEWISFTTLWDVEFKLWLVNDAFVNQFAYYEIVVCPPIPDVDAFFLNYAETATRLKAITPAALMDTIQEKKGQLPETVTRILNFPYYNRNNLNQFTESHWGVLIYGAAGDNVDAIKAAITEYLVEESTHPQTDWTVLLPGIFKRTEFLFFPRWDQIAVPNLSALSALYKSVLEPMEVLDYVQRNHPDNLSATEVANRTALMPFDYKALMVAVVTGETNDADKRKLENFFKDYLPLSTSELDFNRMQIQTREWVVRMVALLSLAETATEYSTIPQPFRRTQRGNQLFLSFQQDNVNYLVSARTNGLR